MNNKTNVNNVKEGDRFSLIRYCEVTEVRDNKFTVETDDGHFWQVDKGIVRDSCYTANQFEAVEKETRTQLAARFEKMGDVIFTVMFHKKPKPEEIADTIQGLEEDPREWNQAKRRKLARDFLAGEERILIGHLKSQHPDVNGRMKVFDLEKGEDRLVDPRTIEWLVHKGVKYEVK